MNNTQEMKLASMYRNRPEILSVDQRNLAEAQHVCRTVNRSPNACDRVNVSTARACEECLARMQAQ